MKIVKLLFVGVILMACDRLPDIRSNARMAYHFDELMYDTFVCYGDGSGRGSGANKPYGSYQLLGNLILDFTYDAADDAQVSDYRRELDLEQALATLSFRKGKTEYSREVFT